jgi:hypothetical protein
MIADSCLSETVALSEEPKPFCVWYKASLARLLEKGVGLSVTNRLDLGGMSSVRMGEWTSAGSCLGGGVVARLASEPRGNSGAELK